MVLFVLGFAGKRGRALWVEKDGEEGFLFVLVWLAGEGERGLFVAVVGFAEEGKKEVLVLVALEKAKKVLFVMERVLFVMVFAMEKAVKVLFLFGLFFEEEGSWGMRGWYPFAFVALGWILGELPK